MKYNLIVMKILHELGVYKLYKGSEYIVSCINYIDRHETDFTPVTKVLYVDIAKLHNTSRYNVESGIRSIIEFIWDREENKELLKKIFGRNAIARKPANLEFLISLYHYVKFQPENINVLAQKDIFVCPSSHGQCPFYKDIVITMMEEISSL